MMVREFKIGEEVLVIREREDFYGGKDNQEPSVPKGWKGTVTNKRLTEDNFRYVYDLQGEDGSISTGYASYCLMENSPGMQEVITRISHLLIGTNNEIEHTDLQNAITYIKELEYNSPESLMIIAYYFGKTVGVREERQRKKDPLRREDLTAR